mgnify:CR=1 FL=1
MIGSIIGDIVGSIYEFSNIRTKDFEFFGRYVEYTDDSILTLATADAILAGRLSLVADYYVRYAEAYPSPMEDMETVSRIGSSRRQEPDMLRHTTAAATDRPCV